MLTFKSTKGENPNSYLSIDKTNVYCYRLQRESSIDLRCNIYFPFYCSGICFQTDLTRNSNNNVIFDFILLW